MSSAMEKLLVRTTYRTILRSANAIDRDPALRAVLVAAPCSFYNRMTLQWTSVDVQREWLEARRVIDSHIIALNRGKEWYLPVAPASASAAAEEAGRPPHPLEPTLGQNHELRDRVRHIFRETPFSTSYLNNAFSAVKVLSYVMQLRQHIPVCHYYLPRAVGVNADAEGAPVEGDDVAKPFEVIPRIIPIAPGKLPPGARQRGRTRGGMNEPIIFKVGERKTPKADKGEDKEQKARRTGDDLEDDPNATLPTPMEVGLQLLVAHPLTHGFFRHSIILINQAGPSGSTGFIINKPIISEDGLVLPVWSVIPDSAHPLFNTYLKDNLVFIGGPVSSAMSPSHAIFLLYRVRNVPRSLPIGPDIFLGSDFDGIYAAFQEGRAKPEDVMVVLGYSGWGSTQLEGEIKSGAWLVLRRHWEIEEKTIEKTTSRDELTPVTASDDAEKARTESGEDSAGDAAAKAKDDTILTMVEKPVYKVGTAADFLFGRNVIVQSKCNVPRTPGLPLKLNPHDPFITDEASARSYAPLPPQLVSALEQTTQLRDREALPARRKEGGKAKTKKGSAPPVAEPASDPAGSMADLDPEGRTLHKSNAEPFLSWVALFGSLGERYKAMTRLADIRTEGTWEPEFTSQQP